MHDFLRTLVMALTVVTFCGTQCVLAKGPRDPRPEDFKLPWENVAPPMSPRNIHFRTSQSNRPEINGCNFKSFARVSSVIAVAGLGGYTTYHLLDPSNRAERETLAALNEAHENWDLGAGKGKTFVDADDLFHLSVETHLRTQELIHFLGEDANHRKLRDLGTIKDIQIVRDRRDQAIQRSVLDSTIVTMKISSDGDRESWRNTLEDFATSKPSP